MQSQIARNIFILLLALIPICSYGQIGNTSSSNSQQRPPIIAGITVEGNLFIDDQTVITISGLRVGDELKQQSDMVPTAVKNIWARKQFSDVRIELDRITSLGAFLIIRVKENPRMSWIDIQGNSEISYDKLKTEIGKIRGDIVSYSELWDIRRKIRKLYEKEGLLFAKVNADTVSTDTAGYVKLLINIEEGDEYKVAKVNIIGNTRVATSDVIGAMEENRPKAWWQLWKSSKFERKKLYDVDVPSIIKYYKNNGFLDIDTLRTAYDIDTVNSTVDITIELNEGNKYILRDVTFSGSTIYQDEYLTRKLALEKGKPLNVERLDKNLNGNEDQNDIKSLYMDNGYLTASITYDTKRVSQDSVDVAVQIFERDRFTIRRVDIVGNGKTQDRVVRRELFTRPGDYFNRGAIIRSIKGLGVLNYFNPEKLRPNIQNVAGSPNQVDLQYQVEERSTDVLNASVGYAGIWGITASIGVTFNNFDILDPLRGGAGQVFSFQYDRGANNSIRTFSVSFAEPWLFGKPTSVGFNIFDTRSFWGFGLERRGITANLGRRFRFPDDYFRGDWSATFQRQNQISASALPDTAINEFSFQQTISRISFDNLIFPSSGSRFRWTSNLALGSLGIGNADFWRNDVQFEFVNPLVQVDGFNRLVLYVNSEMGAVTRLGDDPSHIIPRFQYYTMGGNGIGAINGIPLRGYVDRSVGQPGNNNLLYIRQTAELRFALSLNPMPIYLSTFAEAGNAWDRFANADLFNLRRSAGVGMRILLNPIGLIGFDYGYGFDRNPRQWEFHIQFGR